MLYQFATGTGHAWKSAFYASSRPDSCLGEWNIYGEFLCINIAATLMLLLTEKSIGKKKLFLSCVLVSLLVSLIISLNRTSWVSLAAGIMFASLVFIRKIKLRWIIIAGLIIAITTGGFIYNRFKELSQKKEGYSQNTFQARINYWEKMIPLISKKPIIGYGIGSSVIVGDRYFKKGAAPHNDYLRLALEVGIPGALLYLLFLCWALFKAFMSAKKSEEWEIAYPALMIIVYIVILSTFQNIIYNVTIFPMFMALLALSHKMPQIKVKYNDTNP